MRKRPKRTTGTTVKAKVACSNLYVTVNADDDGICEVFTHLGRQGGCPSQSEATARLISLSLRLGGTIEQVADQLRGIKCHSCSKTSAKSVDGLSCPDVIGRVLEDVAGAVTPETPSHECPECHQDLVVESGCNVCKHCGYSKCG
jgi:ribonucleoside-diphosphate reductase alpha chain